MLDKYGIQAGEVDGEPLKAEVNHGIWIVKCECGGAEKAWEEGMFMCQSCWNSVHGHKFRKTTFPRQRKQIEVLLLKRRIPNRNYLIGESIEQLKLENEQHREELL